MNPEIAEAVQAALAVREFTVQLSATARGARLARLLATEQLRAWGLPFEDAAHVVAELAANAATHGRVSGRDFHLSLTATEGVLRVEVADTRGDRLPHAQPSTSDGESGRGLVLVEALADRWGVTTGPPPRKTVWAELILVREGALTGTRSTTSR
ncbi:ATP-binding protein [Streptomyces sp. NPDC001530]|uniref:ATP-binding protein n=1 Tax=Streptomyces sp. NPDC001530 TaxID=3364582 RepID=UPI0036C1E6F0